MSIPNPTPADHVNEHDHAVGTPNPTHIIAEAILDGRRELDSPKTSAAHVVSKLTDAGYSIVKRDALARAMYLDQARHHVHPDDSMSPEQSWDEGFFPRKSLWLEEADYILAAAAEGEKP